MRALLSAVAAALVLAVVSAGCGSNAAEEKKVRATVNALYDSLSEKNSAKFCDSLTAKQRKAVTAGGGGRAQARSCEQVIGFALTFAGKALKDAKDAKVQDVQVDGDKAKATVVFKGRKGGVALAKEGGEWKVSNFNLKKL